MTRAEMAIAVAQEDGIGIIDRGFRSGETDPQMRVVQIVKRKQHGIIRDPHTKHGRNCILRRVERGFRSAFTRARPSLQQSGGGTTLRLKREQRAFPAETVRDVANIAAGAMVFGRFLGSQMFSVWIAIGGVAVWVATLTTVVH